MNNTLRKIFKKILSFFQHLSSFKIIIFGFIGVILLGSFILMTPLATRDEAGTSFFDALFTATSATCVTGLIVHDTATHWTAFGQAVILTLIQIGGMGVVTVALWLSILSGKRIGLMQRRIMQESISAPQVGGIVRLTRFIIKTVAIIELCAAAAMSPVFIKEFGILKGIWFSVFHSVSAFCNAGFDLMGAKEPFSSLTYFSADPLINIVLMLLIIIGGIGFSTWDDIRQNKLHLKKYKMQSKVILMTSAILIVVPAVYFFFFEYNSAPLGERVLTSVFQSVTIRTAGFNSTDYSKLSQAGVALMIPFMLIGGSPGSTAGGMKTTTIAVLFSSAISVFKGRENAHFFSRRIDNSAVRQASTILCIYVTLCFAGAIAISAAEDLPLLTCLFETASAIGTVGLSLGITGSLGIFSKVLLVIFMFLGRIGSLTLVFAIFSRKNNGSSLPLERITVG